MKHGYLWRGIAATTALGIILLPGSFVVRADGHGGERKNVRGDGNPDESRQLLPTTRADRPDIAAAEGGGNVRGGGQIPREAGAESVSDTKHNTEKGRHLKKKDKKNQLFNPPGGQEGEDDEPADSLFVDTKKADTKKAKSDKAKSDKFKPKTASEEAIEGRWIVVLADDTEDWDVDFVMDTKAKNHHGRAQKKLHKAIKGGVVDHMSAADAKRLSEDPNVLLVEQDAVVHAIAATTPPWGLDRIDQEALPLDNAYNSGYGPGGGTGAVVYVIDTGIRSTHEEFAPPGRAFTSEYYDVFSGDDNTGGIDCDGHGTHCAGTVAGKNYGVAPGANIVGVRVLDCEGFGSWSGIIEGMNKVAVDCEADDQGIGTAKAGTPFAGKRCVASMSLGGGASAGVDAAVANLRDIGVPVIVAAGNENADACNSSPAGAEKAFTVGSTDRFDVRSSFSNFGACLDIFAPGSSILSAWYNTDTATNTISGTSMATPHVAGAAALILGANPTFTADQVEEEMLSKAVGGIADVEQPGSPNKLLHVAGCDPPCGTNAICSSGTCVCATGWGGQTCDVCTSNAACDDDIFCNGVETCSDGSCQAGSSPCSSNQICSEMGDGICLNECHSVTLELITDNYPGETSWQITGQGVGPVISKSGYTSTGTFNEETPCLPDDVYTFTINDSYGDGICCSYGEGSYTLTDHDGKELAKGGGFTSSESTDFTVTLSQEPGAPTSSPSKNPTAGPTPSPSKSPTAGPTPSPSKSPTAGPTPSPSKSPTAGPTPSPSKGPTAGVAKYDSTLGVPACLDLSDSCEARGEDGLMMSRGNVGPGEPNLPNTLDDCPDGGSGSFHNDESNDALKVHTVSGNTFAEGEEVMITATVYAWSDGSEDMADFYYTADATNPNWAYITSVMPPSGGQQYLTANYTLPAGELQAVRVNFRYGGTNKTCSTGAWDDTDDLAFVVSASVVAPSEAPSETPSSSPVGAASANPSALPSTTSPTGTPTASPTKGPTNSPTDKPSAMPSVVTSSSPTMSSDKPSVSPSAQSSSLPSMSSDKPSARPIAASGYPSEAPSSSPVVVASGSPSSAPSKSPTAGPTPSPSKSPTAGPTPTPSKSPTAGPTPTPSKSPTAGPTPSPSKSPTAGPTPTPSKRPTAGPTPAITLAPAPASWEEITSNGFENGSGDCSWNGWTDASPDNNAKLITYRSNVKTAPCALRIQHNTNSRVTSGEFNVANKSKLRVSFWYKPRRMSGSDNFHLDISKGDGDFVPVRTWSNMPSGYNPVIVEISLAGVSNVQVRFECKSAAKNHRVFIDDIKIDAM